MSSLNIDAYQMNCERIEVDKSGGTKITFKRRYGGDFRGEANIMHPIVDLYYSNADSVTPDFNYVQIVEVGRYYFVDDYTFIRTGLVRLNLSIDVLYTYKTQILSNSGIVARSAANESPLLPDSMRPTLATQFLSQSYWGSLDPFKIDESTVYTTSTAPHNAIIMVMSEGTPAHPYAVDSSQDGIVIPNSAYLSKHVKVYAVTTEVLEDVVNFAATSTGSILSNQLLSTWIVGAWVYPMDLAPASGSQTSIKLGDVTTIFSGYLLATSTNDSMSELYRVYNFGAYVSAYSSTSYLSYEPYSRYQVFLPYIGFREIDARELFRTSDGLGLKYIVDLQTGMCQAVIYSVTAPARKVLIETGQIGVQFPLSSSNAGDVTRNTLNFATQTATAAAMGLAQANPMAAVAGLASAGIGFVSNNHITVRGSMPSSQLARFVVQRPQVYEQHQRTTIPSNYGSLVGFPSMVYHAFNTLNGYAVIDTVHLEGFGTATRDEVQAIEDLLKSGVIFTYVSSEQTPAAENMTEL